MSELLSNLRTQVSERDNQIRALRAFETALEAKLAEQNEDIIQKDQDVVWITRNL